MKKEHKAFPNRSISIEYFGVNIKNSNNGIFIKKCKDVEDEEFKQSHTNIFTPSEYEMSQLENKVNQRLYLSREVSPGHLILDLSLDSDKLTDRVIQYFKGKDTEKIVFKTSRLSSRIGQYIY